MSTRKLAAALVFVAASVVNPGYFAGCAADDEFQFDAEDMAEVLRRSNGSHDIVLSGVTYTVAVELVPGAPKSTAQSLFGAAAYACGSRTVYTSAAACIDATLMPVEGSVKVYESTPTGPTLRAEGPVLQGDMRVNGLRLSGASISLSFADGRVTLESPDAETFRVQNLAVRNVTPLPPSGRPAR